MTDVAARLGAALGSRYRIEGELGRGGMATVFLAEDVRHGRPVAVKVLRPDLTASLGAARFLREIGIAARLSHPHIVPLMDSGETDGLLWFVSPFIAGGSLRARLEKAGGHLAVDEALRIAREVGMGLDYVHRNGFVHRDIKPENILFADDHAVLADFGIARACCGPGASGVTEIGLALGTPAYMSPEAAAGDPGLQSTADVYSFACVLYEMLAGAPPFTGDPGRAVMARHVTETPRSLRALRPEVPDAVVAAVQRALAKDPQARFPSVADFLAALEAASAPRTGVTVDRCIAVLPFVNASPDPDNEYLSDGITDELIAALAKVEGLRVASRTSVFALKGRAQDVRALGALLGATEVLEGTVRRAGDRLRITAQLTSTTDGRLLWSERYDRRLDDVFAIQDEIARTIVDTLRAGSYAELAAPVPRRYTADVAAYSLYLRGRYAWNRRSQEGVAEAIRLFEQAIARDPSYAPAYAGLADAWALHVDYRSVPVHEGFAKAKAYARQALELDDRLAEAHASLAWSLFIYDWDRTAADREFRRAIELQPTYATAHQWYAFQLLSEGRFADALVEAHTAQELDPASISIRRALGFAYYYARRYGAAAYHCRRAIAMNPAAEESHRILGLVLVEQGKGEESVRVMREALAIPGSGSYSKAMLGHALARAGHADEARDVLEELARIAKAEYVSPVAFATVHASLGDVDAAIDWIERAIDERRGWPAYLRVHPIADPLRGSPRFRGLLERMGLS